MLTRQAFGCILLRYKKIGKNMFNEGTAKRIIVEAPEFISALQKDLEVAKSTLSEEGIRLIESVIKYHKARILEAELSLKFSDYQ
jgi:hypothetical protein